MGLTIEKLPASQVPAMLAEAVGTDQFAFKESKPYYAPLERAWQVFHPAYVWTCGIVDHRASTIIPRPKTPERWRVGFVQNVLYQRFSAEYERGKKEMEWKTAMLDATDQRVRPYSHVQTILNLQLSLEGVKTITIKVDEYLPYRDVAYGPTGVGEVRDPFTPLGDVAPARHPLGIHFGDRPGFKIDQMAELGRLKRAVRLSVHRFWVLAMQHDRAVALAATSPFTLASSLDVGGGSGFGQPEHDWLSTAAGGDRRRDDPRTLKSGGNVSLARAETTKGIPNPVVTGKTANEVTQEWARQVKLASP
jgi:hypothetical protein